MALKRKRGRRYAAKLLFQFKVSCAERRSKRRVCEERIVLFWAASADEALNRAKKRGYAEQHSYNNSDGNIVQFEFVGILDLLKLGVECEDDEVWYDIKERLQPMERQAVIIPAECDLTAVRNELGSRRPETARVKELKQRGEIRAVARVPVKVGAGKRDRPRRSI
ncbi:MAG TPA: DUF4288 domain-containing protein [Pirellulales bacterium]|jgi:hypothetical protein|nr:DUF4288 domain-containing protein [Pirellulales bacterium]